MVIGTSAAIAIGHRRAGQAPQTRYLHVSWTGTGPSRGGTFRTQTVSQGELDEYLMRLPEVVGVREASRPHHWTVEGSRELVLVHTDCVEEHVIRPNEADREVLVDLIEHALHLSFDPGRDVLYLVL